MKHSHSSAGTAAGDPGAVPAASTKARGLWRIFRDWISMSGAYMAMANCPFCGRGGCPVGLVGAGIFGALIVGAIRLIRRFRGNRTERGG